MKIKISKILIALFIVFITLVLSFDLYRFFQIRPAIKEYKELSRSFSFKLDTDSETLSRQGKEMYDFLKKYRDLATDDPIVLLTYQEILSGISENDSNVSELALKNMKMIHDHILSGKIFGLLPVSRYLIFFLVDILALFMFFRERIFKPKIEGV